MTELTLTAGAFLIIIGMALTLLLLKKGKHRHYINQSNKCLKKLKNIDHPAKQFNYIRKVNPFVFEEMILTSLKEIGYKIKRNKKYTGDGGVDGRFYIDGKLIIVQAKRYSNSINPSHVEEFNQLCHNRKCHGIFVHSGKTGQSANLINKFSKRIDIISGNRLLLLLLCDSFQPCFLQQLK